MLVRVDLFAVVTQPSYSQLHRERLCNGYAPTALHRICNGCHPEASSSAHSASD